MPPPPPPPPAKDFKPPPKSKGRGDLLKSIEGFKKGKLKKGKTIDKSSPSVSKVSSNVSNNNSNISSGGSSNNVAQAPMGMALGGLFAGGMPSLRKTGRPGAATMLPSQDSKPPSNEIKQPPKVELNSTKETKVEIEKVEEKPLPTPPTKPKELQNTVPQQTPIVVTQKKETVIQPETSTIVNKPPVTEVVTNKPEIINKPVLEKKNSILPPVAVKSNQKTQTNSSNTVYQTPVTLQRPTLQNMTNNSSSVLPKISYKVDIDIDDFEEHPSIPRYHNPLVATISKPLIQRNAPTSVAIIEDDIPSEEPLPEILSIENDDNEYEDEVLDPILNDNSLVVETISVDDSYQPKAACELQPKRKKLLTASRLGDIDTVMNILQQEPTQMRRKELLNGLEVDDDTNIRTSPLHFAIEYGHLSLVASLLSQGANTLLEDAFGNTAMHTVCKTQNNSTMEIFSFLMNSSCNVKAQNRAGNTPLHIACMLTEDKTSLYPQMVYTLVTNPFADLLIQNSQGFTALMYASQSGDIDVVKLMLSRLSSKNTITLLNMTANILSPSGPKKVNAVTIASDRNQVGDITKLLMEYGAEPSPNNILQSSLGPLLSHISVPPIEYPSNRISRILDALALTKHASDDDALTCLNCNVNFGVMTRRHHCRNCGMVYCSKCSNNQQILPTTTKQMRVCATCFKFISWYSPIQLVSSKFFIEREALIYRNELERFHDDSVAYVIDKFDNEESIQQFPNYLSEPTWHIRVNTKSFKLDDAFTVSKLPTGQGNLPDESDCSLFEFAALYERLSLISEYCLDIHDMLDLEDISLDDSSSGIPLTISQQKATIFILLTVGAQIYSLISRLSEQSSLFKFLDSSYFKIREMLKFICEVKACSGKQQIEFSFSVLDKYDISNATPSVSSSSLNNSQNNSIKESTGKLIVSEVDIEPLPEEIIQEELPSSITGTEEPKGILGKLFTKKTQSQVDITSEIDSSSSDKIIVADIDIEPLPELSDDSENEPIVEEPKKTGFFSNLFTKKDSSGDLTSLDNDESIPPPPSEPAPPIEEIEEKPIPEKTGLFSKLFSRKDSQNDLSLLDDKSTDESIPLPPSTPAPIFSDDEEQDKEEQEEKAGLFSKLFSRKDSQVEEKSPETSEDTSTVPEEKTGLFSKLFRKSSTITEEVLNDEDNDPDQLLDENDCKTDEPTEKVGLFSKLFTKKTEEIDDTDKSDTVDTTDVLKEDKPEENKRFSFFRRKTSTIEPEIIEKPLVGGVPTPSPSLDLEDDEIVIPRSTIAPSKPDNETIKSTTENILTNKEIEEFNEKHDDSSVNTPISNNFMSEMKSKMENIPVIPPTEVTNIIKKPKEETSDPLTEKPLPLPPTKQIQSPIKKSTPVPPVKPKTPEPEPLPNVENNLFAEDDDEEDFLFSNPKTLSNKPEPKKETKPNEPKPKETKPNESKPKETNNDSDIFGKAPTSLFGDSDSDEIFTLPNDNKKSLTLNEDESSSLIDVDDDFFAPVKETINVVKKEEGNKVSKINDNNTNKTETTITEIKQTEPVNIKQDNENKSSNNTLIKHSPLDNVDDNDIFTKKEENKESKENKNKEEIKQKDNNITSLFGGDDDFEIPIKKKTETDSKKTKQDSSLFEVETKTTKTSNSSLFGVEDDFGIKDSLFGEIDDSDSLFTTIPSKNKSKKPIKKQKSLFEIPDDEENELFASKKPKEESTTKTLKSKRSTTLFDDTDDLFGF